MWTPALFSTEMVDGVLERENGKKGRKRGRKKKRERERERKGRAQENLKEEDKESVYYLICKPTWWTIENQISPWYSWKKLRKSNTPFIVFFLFLLVFVFSLFYWFLSFSLGLFLLFSCSCLFFFFFFSTVLFLFVCLFLPNNKATRSPIRKAVW